MSKLAPCPDCASGLPQAVCPCHYPDIPLGAGEMRILLEIARRNGDLDYWADVAMRWIENAEEAIRGTKEE